MTISRSCHRYLVGIPASSVLVFVLSLSSVALASGRMGEIHEYCGEATAIVIGSPISYSEKGPSAEFAVTQWIKAMPAKTQPATRPGTLRLSGGHGNFEGQTFPMLAGKGQTFSKLANDGRFLVFVFPGNRTGDGRLGSIIEIDKDGNLPKALFLRTLEPQPKTIDDLVGQLRRVLSLEYRKELIQRLENTDLRDPERADAARFLGGLYARDAWAALEAQASKPGTTKDDATIRQSLLALFRMDEVKATPICLRVAEKSLYDQQVATASWLLSRRPPTDPKALDILLDAAARWETNHTNPDHPLPELMQAIAALGRKTSPVEALVMRNIENGTGNVLVTSMYAAGQLKICQAVPLICKYLEADDKNLRLSAFIAVAHFVPENVRPWRGANRPISDDDARKTAAGKFSTWEPAILKAKTIECLRGNKIVCASDSERKLYVLVTWQQQSGEAQPSQEAVLLYRTDNPRR